MTSLDLVKPWRLIASMLVLLYASLLLVELPNSSKWLLLACGTVLAAIMLAARLEYSMLALWPAFVGLFVISACMCALIEAVVDFAIVPFTDSDAEIVTVALVGVGFIGWGIQTTRKMLAY